MDKDRIMAQFHEEMGTARPTEESQPLSRQEATSLPIPQTARLKIIIAAIAVVGILFVILLVKQTIDKYEKESQVTEEAQLPVDATATLADETLDEQKLNQQEAQKTKISTAVNNPENSSEPLPKPDKDTNEVPLSGQAEPIMNASGSESTPSPPAPQPSQTPTSAETLTPKAPEKTANLVAEPPATGTQVKGQEIIIEALDSVQIEFSIDGGETKKAQLKGEQLYTVKGRRSIHLKVSNGGAINLIHNGRDQGVPGDLGKSLEVKFQ